MTPRPVARREARLSRAVAAAAGAGARAHADRVLAIAAEVHARGYAVVPILAGARLERLQDGMAHIFAALGRLDAEAQARGGTEREGLRPAARYDRMSVWLLRPLRRGLGTCATRRRALTACRGGAQNLKFIGLTHNFPVDPAV